MKNQNSSLLLATFIFLLAATGVHAQVPDSLLTRCASTERDSAQFLKNPELLRLRKKSEQAIQEHIRANRSNSRTGVEDIVTIPVVVHVVHNQSDHVIGGANNANISDEQIQSQIDVLNEDYSNTSGYKGFYTDSLGVDTGIRFKLISIVRNYDAKSQFSPITDDISLASISPPWYTNRYLNIWVCRLSDRYLGTSQFPTVTEINDRTDGLNTEDLDEDYVLTDGVIIDSRYFGRNSSAITSRIYNLGRTTTHEVGHWLGLIHTWGDSFCGTDYCNDTPVAYTKNETTDLSCTPVFSDCGPVTTRNMIENYMDYSPDICMSIFTNDQKARMNAVLALSPRRAKLVEYSRRTDPNVTLELFPNPVAEYLTANVYTPDYGDFTLSVFNQKGVKMTEDIVNRSYINVKNFPGGLYILKVTTDRQTVTKRFVIR